MDEYRLDRGREISEGQTAQALLDAVDPYIRKIEENLIHQFETCSLNAGSDILVMIKLQLRAAQALRQLINEVVLTGDMAFKDLFGEQNDSYQQ